MSSAEWKPFHQHEALTTRLANILEEYPPGVSTLREYVQNADDAGASTLVLCLDAVDSGGGGTASYPTPALGDYDGSALLVYNDATFSERDFESISSIGKSRKREDSATIGRYGLGFNVSYHFTDVVQFVSGDDVVLFDPHGRALPDGQLGMRATFTGGLGAQYPSLLAPLLRPLARLAGTDDTRAAADDSGIDYTKRVDGTLFRLPLRSAEQAASSQLSKRSVSAEDVRGLLSNLCEAGLGEMLLFTQSLTSVRACVMEADGSFTTLGSASVLPSPSPSLTTANALSPSPSLTTANALLDENTNEATRAHRAALAGFAHSAESMPLVDAPLTFELYLRIEDSTRGRTDERWLMCGGGLHDEESLLLAAAIGQPAAWATVALPMHAPVRGRAFCFLPLPLPSGLPCHVNGCFAVTSNRRDLWTEGADKTLGDQSHARKARWNALLCAHALPRLYASALEHIAADDMQPRGELTRGDLLGALIPTGAESHGPLWRSLQRATLTELAERQACLCACYDEHDKLGLASFDGVVVADANLARGPAYSTLRAALRQTGRSLWAAPAETVAALRAAGQTVRRATPRRVCEWLRAAVPADGELPEWWDTGLVAEVLAFVLGSGATGDSPSAGGEGGSGSSLDDEDDDNEMEHNEGGEMGLLSAAAALVDLRIIPLANGSLGSLRRAGRTDRAAGRSKGGKGAATAAGASTVPQYIITDAEGAAMLPGCDVLIDPSVLPLRGFVHLSTLAGSRAFNLVPRLDATMILRVDVMSALLDASWHGRSAVSLRGGEPTAASGAAGGSTNADSAAAETPAVAARGWQPKGKFSGSKKAAKPTKLPVGSFRKGGASAFHTLVAAPSTGALPSATVLDETTAAARLAFLWQLVDEAVSAGELATADISRLEEWPTVLTSNGEVVSITHARKHHVLRARAFADDDAARGAVARFGVAFATHASTYLDKRVCGGPERLGLALESALSEQAASSPAEDATPLADCLALRTVILAWCVQPSEGSVAETDAYVQIDLSDDGESSPSDRTASPPNRKHAPRAAIRDSTRVPLPSAVVRKLPVFMTICGDRCVPLRTSHAAAAAVIGTPGTTAYQDSTPLDDALKPSLGGLLLSYTTDEERTLLRLAEWPRATPTDLVRFLSARLRLSGAAARTASADSDRQQAPATADEALQLPVEVLLLMLGAVGGSKEVRLNPNERDELIRRLSDLPVVILPSGERMRAAEFVDPTDELLAQAMRATTGGVNNGGTDEAGGSEDDDDAGDSGGVDVGGGGVLSMRLFPPTAYTQSAYVVTGLRACGMRSLDEPATFLAVAEGVAAAGMTLSQREEVSAAAAVGRALLRMLIDKWAKVGGAMSPMQLTTLRRTAFVPCIDMRKASLPDDTVSPPNLKVITRLETELSTLRNGKGAAVGGKRNKRAKGGGQRGGGGMGGGDGGWSLLEEDLAAAHDLVAEAQLDDAAAVSGEGRTSGDELQRCRRHALVQIGSWCTSVSSHRRTALSRSNDGGGTHEDDVGRVVWSCLEGGSTCLEADAWLGWTQLLLLPKCANLAPASVLGALGITHPLPALPTCRHLARIANEWRARPASWRAQVGVLTLQSLSLLCCSHAAIQMRADGLTSGGGPELAALSAQVGARPEVRRALASAPYIVADDGTLVIGRHVCVDLFSDLGPHARAVPTYLAALTPFLVEVGHALTSSALAAPEVTVSAPNPFEVLFPQIMAHVDDPSFADVVFVFGGADGGGAGEGSGGGGGEHVYAHKLLLALSSPTFAAMFTSALAEGRGGQLMMPMDESLFGADALRLALTYMYTGELPIADDTHPAPPADAKVAPLRPTSSGVARLLEVLLVADYLQLEHLKQLGERLIIDWEVLQVENVVDVYEHASGAKCAQLKASCVQYIRGMFEVVQETEAWARLGEGLQREVTELKQHQQPNR